MWSGDDGRSQRTRVGEQALDFGGQLLVRRGQDRARGDEHEEESFVRNARPAAPDDFPDAAARAIALHRTADAALAGDPAQARDLTGTRQ